LKRKGCPAQGQEQKVGTSAWGWFSRGGCPYLDGQTCTGLAWQSRCRCYLRFPFVQKSVHSFPFMQSGHVSARWKPPSVNVVLMVLMDSHNLTWCGCVGASPFFNHRRSCRPHLIHVYDPPTGSFHVVDGRCNLPTTLSPIRTYGTISLHGQRRPIATKV